MNTEQLYPKTIDKLFEKIEYIIKNEQNNDKILKLANWKKWYSSQNYKLEYVCREDEYLKIYYDDEKYALQVWKHDINVDSIKFNLLSNFYSEYDSEITIVNI